VEEQTFVQIGPGFYKGVINTSLAGDYYITIEGKEGNTKPVTPRLFGYTIPYSPEYKDFSLDLKLLQECAHITGGNLLYFGDDEGEKTLFSKSKASEIHRLWGFLLSLACILFIVEIIMRKLIVSRRFLHYFIKKERKQDHFNRKHGYKDMKSIMEQMEKEEKKRIQEQIRERLKKKTGLSTDTPDLFLALKGHQKK
jgi:hypothetical protein